MYDVVHFNGDRTTILFDDLLQKNKHFLIINWEQFDVLINHSQIKKNWSTNLARIIYRYFDIYQ